jgi:hypothetical protein
MIEPITLAIVQHVMIAVQMLGHPPRPHSPPHALEFDVLEPKTTTTSSNAWNLLPTSNFSC